MYEHWEDSCIFDYLITNVESGSVALIRFLVLVPVSKPAAVSFWRSTVMLTAHQQVGGTPKSYFCEAVWRTRHLGRYLITSLGFKKERHCITPNLLE